MIFAKNNVGRIRSAMQKNFLLWIILQQVSTLIERKRLHKIIILLELIQITHFMCFQNKKAKGRRGRKLKCKLINEQWNKVSNKVSVLLTIQNWNVINILHESKFGQIGKDTDSLS